MAKKITLSWARSKLRQIKSKLRRHNQKVKRAVRQYNSGVRKHNARVRADRQRVLSQLRRMHSSSSVVRYQVLRSSSITLNERYESLESKESEFHNNQFGAQFLDLSERENANSLEVTNTIELDDDAHSGIDEADLTSSEVSDELLAISPDLDKRWKGALFSLSPKNPDAARHFCTSAREVFVQILDLHAPDDEVLSTDPECEKTDKGGPTRKAKIKHLLVKSGIHNQEAVDFVDEDVKNVLQLFGVFNDGTHGSSGRFDLNKLMAIKTRVENGITYLSSICNYA